MGNGFIIVDEKDWAEMTEDQRSWAVYKTLRSLDERMRKLEKRPVADKCFAFLGGVIGGFLAAIGLRANG
jgi:hypothetical protein